MREASAAMRSIRFTDRMRGSPRVFLPLAVRGCLVSLEFWRVPSLMKKETPIFRLRALSKPNRLAPLLSSRSLSLGHSVMEEQIRLRARQQLAKFQRRATAEKVAARKVDTD